MLREGCRWESLDFGPGFFLASRRFAGLDGTCRPEWSVVASVNVKERVKMHLVRFPVSTSGARETMSNPI